MNRATAIVITSITSFVVFMISFSPRETLQSMKAAMMNAQKNARKAFNNSARASLPS
jgi:hypothetical protein